MLTSTFHLFRAHICVRMQRHMHPCLYKHTCCRLFVQPLQISLRSLGLENLKGWAEYHLVPPATLLPQFLCPYITQVKQKNDDPRKTICVQKNM